MNAKSQTSMDENIAFIKRYFLYGLEPHQECFIRNFLDDGISEGVLVCRSEQEGLMLSAAIAGLYLYHPGFEISSHSSIIFVNCRSEQKANLALARLKQFVEAGNALNERTKIRQKYIENGDKGIKAETMSSGHRGIIHATAVFWALSGYGEEPHDSRLYYTLKTSLANSADGASKATPRGLIVATRQHVESRPRLKALIEDMRPLKHCYVPVDV